MSRSRVPSLLHSPVLYWVPFLVLVAWVFLPVVAGRETLFLRDVLNTHLEMKWVGAEALRDGWLPLVDVLRSGGQPHLGNPNTVSLYPDNLLYLVASPFWALNAHFWLHLLLAPAAMFWLARQCDLGRPAAWTAGICYATGGYYLSTLNLYNLTAAATLGPALIASVIALTRGDGRVGGEVDAEDGGRVLPLVAATLMWALVLLGGDPMTAAALVLAALAAALVAAERPTAALAQLIAPIGIGVLLAAPQLVEFLRIAPGSYRGVQGYSVATALVSSWSPANLFEWLLPLAFGEPDLLFWGQKFHAGNVPLLASLAPGLVALALAVVAARSGWRWGRFAWGMVAVGLFFALGSYNPLAAWLLGLPGMSIFRLPVKLWVVGAIGLALLAGRGMERFLAASRERRLGRALLVLAGLLAAIAAVLLLAPAAVADLVAGWMPRQIPAEHATAEVRRWLGLSAFSIGLCLTGWALVRFSTSSLLSGRRELAAAGLVALQCLSQGWLLAPLLGTDAVEPYLATSPLLEVVPADARIVHGDARIFSGHTVVDRSRYPGPSLKWFYRDIFQQLFPSAGMIRGLRYEFSLSPEGLDSFLGRAMSQAIQLLDDPRKITFLEVSGVTHLLLGRDLEGVEESRARLVARRPAGTAEIRVYALEQSAAEVEFAGRLLRSTDPRQTVSLMLDPSFDPREAAVLAGPGEPVLGGEGSVEVVRSAAEEMVIDVEARSPGAVVVQRSYLPIWRASLDGVPAEIAIANMHRMAVEVPAGSHRLELAVDRGSLGPAFLVSVLGLLLLGLRVRQHRRGAARSAAAQSAAAQSAAAQSAAAQSAANRSDSGTDAPARGHAAVGDRPPSGRGGQS